MTKTQRVRHSCRLLIAALLIPNAALAQAVGVRELARASLEELMNVKVTSAERREQRADEVPAAVFVITQDDIRRSGLTKLPEILRLVPGMQVGRMNASEWAVSVRGFNSLYSDKLLVLIDGRSLYNRAFSGVFWDAQNMMVADIDRIEVIRGPGGTVWGANAVNGVINVITRSSSDTKGTAVEVSAGTFERATGAVRYGGTLGSLDYRVYSQWSGHNAGLTEARTAATDRWNALTTGARADWSHGPDSVMVQAAYMDTEARPQWLEQTSLFDPPSSDGVSDVDEGAILGRWTRRGVRSVFQFQAFRTNARRDETTLYANEATSDVDAQFQSPLGSRHNVVVGGGFRNSVLTTRGSFTVEIPPDEATVYNAFVQDEISLGRAVKVTAGSKIEHDTLAGWGVLPSARVMWDFAAAQRAWGAVSRARRTPSSAYRTMTLNAGSFVGEDGIPVAIRLLGNPDYRSENLLAYEGGYRVQLGPAASIDVAAYHGRYDHSTTIEPRTASFETSPSPHVLAVVQYDNLLNVHSQGVEISGRWSPLSTWRLDGSYSTVHFDPIPHAASLDAAAADYDGTAPQHQWQVHSTNQLSSRLQFDGGLFHVGRLRQAGVPAYTRADARVEFRLTPQLVASVVGQNLLQAAHREFSDYQSALVGSLVPRSARVQLRWQF